MKSLDPLRAKKIFIRKKLGHTAVSAIKASPLPDNCAQRGYHFEWKIDEVYL